MNLGYSDQLCITNKAFEVHPSGKGIIVLLSIQSGDGQPWADHRGKWEEGDENRMNAKR